MRPDVHLGKGATIGSVFASRDYVCPNAATWRQVKCFNVGCLGPFFDLKLGTAWNRLFRSTDALQVGVDIGCGMCQRPR